MDERALHIYAQATTPRKYVITVPAVLKKFSKENYAVSAEERKEVCV